MLASVLQEASQERKGICKGPRCWGREVEAYTYTKGTLVLDFVEADGLELVCRGYATGAIHDLDKMDETIAEAVRKVLDRFPPQP
jgi:hypothetical protein